MSSQRPFLYKSFSLDDWQQHFSNIYGHRAGYMTSSQIWYRMLEEIGELVQASRPPSLEGIETTLPDLFAWLAALASARDLSLTQAVGDRFAHGCPHCGKREDCSCIYFPGRAWVEASSAEAGLPLFDQLKGHPIDAWVEVFDRLYGTTNRDRSLMSIIDRLVGNAGDVAKLMRERASSEEVEKGVANVFAWIVAIYIKYRSIKGSDTPPFSDIVIEKYARCPKCFRSPCECKPIVSSILVASVADDAFEETPFIRRAVTERSILEFIQDPADEELVDTTTVPAELLIHVKARTADAVALVLNRTITMALQSIFYQSLVRGQPIRVFQRLSTEWTPELSQFIPTARAAGVLIEFRDNNHLRQVFRNWVKCSMKLIEQ